jgi:SSS family solute:Na+ symporter
LPADHPELPWTVLVSGMWIPIFYYCGLNQFITQRALAAGSLKQGQLGVIFAGALWLLVPIAIVMPGIAAQQLYGTRLERMDQAYPMLGPGTGTQRRPWFHFGLAGRGGGEFVGVDAQLGLDHLHHGPLETVSGPRCQRGQPGPGRTGEHGGLPGNRFRGFLSDLLKGGVFKFIQEFQGYISPGILAAFVFGFAVRRAPPAAGVTALVASAPHLRTFGVPHGPRRLSPSDDLHLRDPDSADGDHHLGGAA